MPTWTLFWKWQFLKRNVNSSTVQLKVEGPCPDSLCKSWSCTGRISITVWVKSILAPCRQFVFCISVIVTRVRIADSCVWNFDFHVSLFHFLWSYFCERSLPNKPIVPSAFSGLKGFLVFIKLAESNQYIWHPLKVKAFMGQRVAKNKCHSYFTYSQLNHRNSGV